MTRTQIEALWIKRGRLYSSGMPVSLFFHKDSDLSFQWSKVFDGIDELHLASMIFYSNRRDYVDIIYLTRALSLHMLLDDNNIE